jgi:hypothetical protein
MELGYDENIINVNLRNLNLPILSQLSPNEQNYIRNAEQLLIKVNNERKEGIKKYRDLRITVKFVAEKLGIERQTIYNNPVFNEYIKNAQIKQSKEDIFDKIKDIQKKIKGLEEDILSLNERDVNIELLKINIDELNETLLEKEREINELQSKNEIYLSEIRNIEYNARVNHNNVYEFNK